VRLLKGARKGDVLLTGSIDRLSRLPVENWQKLNAAIDSIRVEMMVAIAGLGIRATARHANCSTTTVLRIRDLASA